MKKDRDEEAAKKAAAEYKRRLRAKRKCEDRKGRPMKLSDICIAGMIRDMRSIMQRKHQTLAEYELAIRAEGAIVLPGQVQDATMHSMRRLEAFDRASNRLAKAEAAYARAFARQPEDFLRVLKTLKD